MYNLSFAADPEKLSFILLKPLSIYTQNRTKANICPQLVQINQWLIKKTFAALTLTKGSGY